MTKYKIYKVLVCVWSVFLLSNCAPSMQYTWSKEGFTGKQFKKLAVVVVSKDYQVRSEVESKIAQDLRNEGFEVVKGITFLGPNAVKSDWETEKIGEKY